MKGPTESEFLSTVLRFARLHRWRSFHQRPGLTRGGRWVSHVAGDGVGWPDLVLLRGPRLVVAELKVGKNTTTDEQGKWLEAWRDVGAEVFEWRPCQWGEIETVLGKGA